MKFIPEWLHYRLLGFRWYRRKSGVLEMSDVTKQALEMLARSI